FIVIDEPETERRLMLPVKNNVGIKAQGRGYNIAAKIVADNVSAPYIIWDDAPVNMTADQAIVAAANHAKEGRRSLAEAKKGFREPVADGPVSASEGEKAASEEGISERTLRRARKELGIIPKKDDFAGGWSWSL